MKLSPKIALLLMLELIFFSKAYAADTRPSEELIRETKERALLNRPDELNCVLRGSELLENGRFRGVNLESGNTTLVYNQGSNYDWSTTNSCLSNEPCFFHHINYSLNQRETKAIKLSTTANLVNITGMPLSNEKAININVEVKPNGVNYSHIDNNYERQNMYGFTINNATTENALTYDFVVTDSDTGEVILEKSENAGEIQGGHFHDYGTGEILREEIRSKKSPGSSLYNIFYETDTGAFLSGLSVICTFETW